MATQDVSLTSTPADIVADLSLTASMTYEIQNVGPGRAYLREADTAAQTDSGFILNPGAWATIKIDATPQKVWCWTKAGQSVTQLAVSLAP